MINLKLKTGVTLSYDEVNEEVLVDGIKNKNWKPSFIPSGDDTPDFFGFLDVVNDTVYDIYGGISKLVKEDSIKL